MLCLLCYVLLVNMCFCLLLFDLILSVAVNIFSVMLGQVFLGRTSTKQGLKFLAKRKQCSDAGEA